MALKPSQNGFTLIEIIVAIGIFTVIAVMGLTALLTMANASKEAAATRSVLDSMGYILEDISRTAQDAVTFSCGNNGSDCTQLVATTSDDTVIHYSIVTTSGVGTIYREANEEGSKPISPNTVDVDKLYFYINTSECNWPSNPGSCTWPRVQVILKAKIGVGTRFETPINLQTTVAAHQP